MVSQIVHSSTTQLIINCYSKMACLCHAAAATYNFAEIISEEGETKEERRSRIMEVVHKHQVAKAAQIAVKEKTEEKEMELDEEAVKEKEKLQEQQDHIIFKSLNKFKQKDMANIPKTGGAEQNPSNQRLSRNLGQL